MKKLTILLLFLPLFASAQEKKWYTITGNDIAVMSVELAVGYAQGWRDEVIYHPNQLFKRFPNLNRSFWDIRVQNPPGFLNTEWDADHVLKATVSSLHVAAVVIKIGDLKDYPKKDRWKKVAFDMVKYYGAYKAGFFLSWNVTHGNKL